MKLSTKSRYGTRILLYMAKKYGTPVQIKEISKEEGITPKYVEQLALLLKKANFIKSVRGPKGGYILSKSPQEISIKDIITALETERALVKCVTEPNSCPKSNECKTRTVWKMATEALLEKLESVTLNDLL